MSKREDNETFDELPSSTGNSPEGLREDPLADTSPLTSPEVPPGVDRRSFLIRSAVGGAAASDDGSLYLGRRENGDGHRHDAAGQAGAG